MRTWVLGGIGLATLAVAQLDTKPIEVSQNYRGPSIELEGVCKITEEAISCWRGDGKSHPELCDNVAAYLRRNSGVTVRYGRKTRLAFFKIRHAAPRAGQQSRLADSLDGDTMNLTDHAEHRETLIGVRITVNVSESKGMITTSISRVAPTSEPLRVEEGAILNYQGATVRFGQVVKSQLDPLVYGASLGRWTLYVAYEGPSAHILGYQAFDHVGLPILAVDTVGKPVAIDPSLLSQLESTLVPGSPQPTPVIFRAALHSGDYYNQRHAFPGRNALSTNIDPQYIKHFTITASARQDVVIKDIPMDPRR